MTPQAKPLLFCTDTDVAAHLVGQICRTYAWQNETVREKSRELVEAIAGYLDTHPGTKEFAKAVREIIICTVQHADAAFADECKQYDKEMAKVSKDVAFNSEI